MSYNSHSTTEKTCVFCETNASKYCCPRCNSLYCSLDCYKSEKHIECSENFYRDCINEELSGQHVDEESKMKMMDILLKLHKEDAGDDESDEDIDSDDEVRPELEERLNGLNLDDADAVWNVLTEDEKNEFEALLSGGDVTSLIPQWEPWWLYSKEDKLVEDIKEDENNEKIALAKCPALKRVPELSSLTSMPPAESINYNIANVLASYTYTMRYFNGEVDPIEGTTFLITISDNLNNNANFDDLETAVKSVVQACIQRDFIQTDETSLDYIKNDVFLIIKGPNTVNKSYYCKSALSHIHLLFTSAKHSLKNPEKGTEKSVFSRKFPKHGLEYLPQIDMSKIKKCTKKLEYYLSYVKSYGFIE